MLNPRIDGLPDYPFARLRQLLDGIAPPAGLEPVTMSIGEPRHPPPAFVGRVLHDHRDRYGSYPPIAGTPGFRAAAAAWLERRYDLPEGMIEADRHVLPLNGTREGLFMAALVAVPEEKAGGRPLALIPNPFYQCYFGAALAAGAEPRLLPARAGDGFLPDFAGLDEAVLARTAVAYFCTPANPQGAVADLAYLCDLVGLARTHGFALLVDECYAEIYDRDPPPGTLAACAALGGDMSNVLVFHSLSKRSNLPGLRSGFAAGDPDLVARFLKLRSYGGAPSPLPVYEAAAAAWRDERHVEASRARYRRKLDLAEDRLGGRFGFYRPAGGFFLWLDVGDGEAAARRLWSAAGVKALPGAYLARDDGDGGNPGASYLRLALVDDEATTAEALDRVRAHL